MGFSSAEENEVLAAKVMTLAPGLFYIRGYVYESNR